MSTQAPSLFGTPKPRRVSNEYATPPINVGSRYAKPYESHYAMIRRCLATNPGRSLATVDAQLRSLVPELGSLKDRLSYIQNMPTGEWATVYPLDRSYSRQCPVCARHLYHTDLFKLPWLSHCPIHHCALTEICPTCQRPWPSLQDLSDRNCPTCGRPSFSALPLDGGTFDLRPLEALLSFIAKDEPRMSIEPAGYAIDDDTWSEYVPSGPLWWRKIGLYSELYPSVQAHRKPMFSQDQLDALHIVRTPVRCMSVKLKRSKPHLAFSRAQLRSRRNQFEVLKRILAWLCQHGHEHPVWVSTDHYRYVMNFQTTGTGLPDCCPYCLALSVWFFGLANKTYYKQYALFLDGRDYLLNGCVPDILYSCFPRLKIWGGRTYCVDTGFSDWLYRRGLELSFVELLESSFEFARRWGYVNRHGTLRGFEDAEPEWGWWIEYWYSLARVDEQLEFFYVNEHPLEHYEPTPLPCLIDQCEAFHDYYVLHDCNLSPDRRYALNPKRFTYHNFMKMYEKFEAC